MHLWPGMGQATHFLPLVTGISFRSLAQITSQGQEAGTLLAGKGRVPSLRSSQAPLLQPARPSGLRRAGDGESKGAAPPESLSPHWVRWPSSHGISYWNPFRPKGRDRARSATACFGPHSTTHSTGLMASHPP